MNSSMRRCALSLAVLSVTLVPVSQANADEGVCNQASPRWLGNGLVALDPLVDSPAARYTVDIGKLPGKGAGLFEAAANSPSLTVCDGGGEVIINPDDPDGGVDVDDGVVDV